MKRMEKNLFGLGKEVVGHDVLLATPRSKELGAAYEEEAPIHVPPVN